ncbi:hypothetical protein KCP75_16385 [Salmonella enterica subsp. enterica]|nr:hypothetical protein KCP75_16385 [Salmonella enterica subsp. enterica]
MVFPLSLGGKEKSSDFSAPGRAGYALQKPAKAQMPRVSCCIKYRPSMPAASRSATACGGVCTWRGAYGDDAVVVIL